MTQQAEPGPWDSVANGLQTLRQGADDPSFGEIARRISERRRALGQSPEAAVVARSSIYDAFRIGRTRMNLGLVREIAAVLEAEPSQVDDWISECRGEVEAPPPPITRHQVILLIAGCIAINLLGRELVQFLTLPLYFDMVGTAIAAIALGPWRGALVGGATNILGIGVSGITSLPFTLVNIAGALVWGYGVRRWGMGRSMQRFFALNLLVAVACSTIAVSILLTMYGGSVGHAQDGVAGNIYEVTGSHQIAVAGANLLTSVVDKLLCGFAALTFLFAAIPAGLRHELRSIMVGPSPVPN